MDAATEVDGKVQRESVDAASVVRASVGTNMDSIVELRKCTTGALGHAGHVVVEPVEAKLSAHVNVDLIAGSMREV